MNILVTSSTGLTGKAIVKRLSTDGAKVRAMIHSASRHDNMIALGAAETVIATIENQEDLRRAMTGMDAVVYICPTAHPKEAEIGKIAIDTASELGIKRFIYQSVLNSIEPQLPHHRQKLQVEQYLLESHLNYSILRPAAFMQNILTAVDSLLKDHIFIQKFFTDIESSNLINLIDINDYASIVSIITHNMKYSYGSYDLSGPQNLSAKDMVTAMSSVVGAEIKLHFITDNEFIEISDRQKVPETKLRTLLAMFQSYNRFGFKGNPIVSQTLLGKKLTDFQTYLTHQLKDA